MGQGPLVLHELYGSSGAGPTRSNQNFLFEWGLILIKTEKVFGFLHNFTIIVVLQRDYTHSFGSKCLIRVGWGPLILIKVCVSSGFVPTRFAWIVQFEWG